MHSSDVPCSPMMKMTMAVYWKGCEQKNEKAAAGRRGSGWWWAEHAVGEKETYACAVVATYKDKHKAGRREEEGFSQGQWPHFLFLSTMMKTCHGPHDVNDLWFPVHKHEQCSHLAWPGWLKRGNLQTSDGRMMHESHNGRIN